MDRASRHSNHSLNFGYGINDSGVAVGDARLRGPVLLASAGLGPNHALVRVPECAGAQPYSTVPDGLNDKGQVVGYAADASYAQHGFIEEGGGVYGL